jgi:hypothetical protein
LAKLGEISLSTNCGKLPEAAKMKGFSLKASVSAEKLCTAFPPAG